MTVTGTSVRRREDSLVIGDHAREFSVHILHDEWLCAVDTGKPYRIFSVDGLLLWELSVRGPPPSVPSLINASGFSLKEYECRAVNGSVLFIDNCVEINSLCKKYGNRMHLYIRRFKKHSSLCRNGYHIMYGSGISLDMEFSVYESFILRLWRLARKMMIFVNAG